MHFKLEFDSPWTFHNYGEDLDGVMEMKKDLDEHYKFTEEEEKHWKQWIDELKEEYEYEEEDEGEGS